MRLHKRAADTLRKFAQQLDEEVSAPKQENLTREQRVDLLGIKIRGVKAQADQLTKMYKSIGEMDGLEDIHNVDALQESLMSADSGLREAVDIMHTLLGNDEEFTREAAFAQAEINRMRATLYDMFAQIDDLQDEMSHPDPTQLGAPVFDIDPIVNEAFESICKAIYGTTTCEGVSPDSIDDAKSSLYNIAMRYAEEGERSTSRISDIIQDIGECLGIVEAPTPKLPIDNSDDKSDAHSLNPNPEDEDDGW